MTAVDDREAATPDDAVRPVNQRAYRAAIISFVIGVGGGVAAAIGYATDNTEYLLGLGLAAALGGIGFGLVSWAKYLDLSEHEIQQREPLRMTTTEVEQFGEIVEHTKETVGRRRLLVVLFGASIASMLVGFVGPIGSLGPKPQGERGRTSWRPGSRLVTIDGQPVEVASDSFRQLVTVFPEGAIGVDDSQVVLMRLPPGELTDRTVTGGAVDGWVAYSKICSHAGCSVGLFAVDERAPDTLRQLVCPCHQSVFDPADGARPVGGPAPRSLPQLPLDVDDDGFLVARDDFDRPVGPLAWDEA